MIVDITSEIITELDNILADVKVSSSYQPTTNEFPIVIVEESDNSTYLDTKDSSGFNHAQIAFKIEIYTIGSRKMSQAKKIRNQIDSVMSGKYGLSRGTPISVPNYLDNRVYRYILHYRGLIDKNKKIYRG